MGVVTKGAWEFCLSTAQTVAIDVAACTVADTVHASVAAECACQALAQMAYHEIAATAASIFGGARWEHSAGNCR